MSFFSPPLFWDSRASETRARENHPTREKARRGLFSRGVIFKAASRLFSRGVIFTRARVSLALLFLRKNGGLLVVYSFSVSNLSPPDGNQKVCITLFGTFLCRLLHNYDEN